MLSESEVPLFVRGEPTFLEYNSAFNVVKNIKKFKYFQISPELEIDAYKNIQENC